MEHPFEKNIRPTLTQTLRPYTKNPAEAGSRISTRPSRKSLQVEEASELLRAGRMAQLAQGLGFYLPDALARDIELLADLFERVVGVHVDAEAHAQHLGLARRKPAQHLLHRVGQAGGGGLVDRRQDVEVFDEVAQVRILVVADGRFHRDRLLGDLEYLA